MGETDEMKTLKDLDYSMLCKDTNCKSEGCIGYSERNLREEAIKWIKEIEDESSIGLIDPKSTEFNCGNDCNEHCCDDGIVNWIKHFFNIKAEELK